MYKRRDFHVLHGEGDDSSSSDEDSDAPAEVSDSEPEEPVARVRGRLARVEDISDKEEDSDDSDAKPDATGPPWKCALCPKALLLTELTRDQHVLSKRHKRSVLRQQQGLPDPLYAAKGRFPAGYPNPDDESEGETHAERLARVRSEHLQREAKAAALAGGKGKGRRAAQRERKRKRASDAAPGAADAPKAAPKAAPRAEKRAEKRPAGHTE